MYTKSILKEYINNTVCRKYKDIINIRLSNDLANQYDEGVYDVFLEHTYNEYKKLLELNIKFPANAEPQLYIYIVPFDNYSELLGTPQRYDSGKGSGKPVQCFDLDGYKCAYGISSNLCENASTERTISKEENNIHELAHLIQIQFYSKNAIISEGLAEAIPLYVMGYEEKFDEHRSVILNLTEEDIIAPKQIIESERDNSYGTKSTIEGKSCSFRYSYISSYLFVRGCIEKIGERNNSNRIEALQEFLNILYQCNYSHEWLIYYIADYLEIDKDELLYGKKIQLDAIESIRNNVAYNL